MNYLSSRFYASFLWQAWQKYTVRGHKDSSASCNTATNRSKESVVKRPSFFLKLSFLALAIAAWQTQQPSHPPNTEHENDLIREGWQLTDSIECTGIETGKFYSLENEAESREFYAKDDGGFLISHLPNIEAPYSCHEIKSISHIQEI